MQAQIESTEAAICGECRKNCAYFLSREDLSADTDRGIQGCVEVVALSKCCGSMVYTDADLEFELIPELVECGGGW